MNAEGCHVGDGYYTTCGGIKVNEKTQILDEEGQVIRSVRRRLRCGRFVRRLL